MNSIGFGGSLVLGVLSSTVTLDPSHFVDLSLGGVHLDVPGIETSISVVVRQLARDSRDFRLNHNRLKSRDFRRCF